MGWWRVDEEKENILVRMPNEEEEEKNGEGEPAAAASDDDCDVSST